MKLIRNLISIAAWSYLAAFAWNYAQVKKENRRLARDLKHL